MQCLSECSLISMLLTLMHFPSWLKGSKRKRTSDAQASSKITSAGVDPPHRCTSKPSRGIYFFSPFPRAVHLPFPPFSLFPALSKVAGARTRLRVTIPISHTPSPTLPSLVTSRGSNNSSCTVEAVHALVATTPTPAFDDAGFRFRRQACR